MPNETNTVGATMELGRLRIENESLRQQNAELVRALRNIVDGTLDTAAMKSARAILATVQS